MGNQPFFSKWRLMEMTEAQSPAWRKDLPFFIIVGKWGKIRRKAHESCPPRGSSMLLITWVKSDIR